MKMNVGWQIEHADIQKVKVIYERHKNNPRVPERIKKNIEKNVGDFSKGIFWKQMVSCLLTTQQQSSPDSAVHKFCQQEPFPLSYDECTSIKNKNLKNFASDTIKTFKGIRRYEKIGDELKENLKWLDSEGWQKIENMYKELKSNGNKDKERMWADFIDDNLKGFGPKQSRNLLQGLGLTKYEIPIDSRLTKWLEQFGFPIKLSVAALGDKHYYHFVSDGIQSLCEASSIYPCILDAVIFSSFDKGSQK